MRNLSDFIAASVESAGSSKPMNNLRKLLEETINQN